MLKTDGSVWASGLNLYGQLGDGSRRTDSKNFERVFASGATAVAAGGGHSLVLKEDDSVWAAGRNKFGQLGDGSNIDRYAFVLVVDSGTQAVAVGARHSLLLKRDGSVWATGSNLYGQLGLHMGSNELIAGKRTFAKVDCCEATAVAAGTAHSMMLKKDGSVWVTGWNQDGQLGDGSTKIRRTFAQIVPRGAQAIAAGGYHSMVLMQDGNVWTVGDNTFGQLGDGTQVLTQKQLKMVTGEVVAAVAISAGMSHSLLLGEDGSVWVAGRNNCGQLGDGTTTSKREFEQIITRGAEVVAAGAWHTMVMGGQHSVWATGLNEYGQLGTGSAELFETGFVKVWPGSDGV